VREEPTMIEEHCHLTCKLWFKFLIRTSVRMPVLEGVNVMEESEHLEVLADATVRRAVGDLDVR
jgi:hypothetical protein